jgi:hypothetical protein
MNSDFADGVIAKFGELAGAISQLRQQPTRTRHNFAAATAPGVGDDIGDGYSVGSLWADIDPLPATIYICRDNASGAAVWTQIAP